jgi:DNA-binding MarR family transcriptional regulator
VVPVDPPIFSRAGAGRVGSNLRPAARRAAYLAKLLRQNLLVILTIMDSGGPVGDVSEVAGALRVAVGLVVRKLRQAPFEGELTLAESSALSRLERGGPATSSDLARLDRISPQSMGVTVAALLERGLIERSRDPEDGRRIVLSITEAGRRMVHDKRGARTEQIASALRNGFSEDELGQLKAAAVLLERLAEKL